MTFIALPHEFDPETGECRGFQIARSADGDLKPIGFLHAGRDLPVDLEKLSQNFASALNGHDPLHNLTGDHQMYFERHAEGMNFRFRGANHGVTEIGAMFTMIPGMKLELEHEQA